MVVLFVAKPYPQVPGVVGRLKSAAVERLQDAGFRVNVTTETIVISSVIRTVAPPPQNCTPGYDPPGTRVGYDCAGGSGDGPKYTGFVRVTGYDPYDLDADGDGTGCE